MCNVQEPLVLAASVGSLQCSLPCAPAYHDLGLAAECPQAHTERLQGSHRAGLLQNSSMAPAVLLQGPAGIRQGPRRAATGLLPSACGVPSGHLRGCCRACSWVPAQLLRISYRPPAGLTQSPHDLLHGSYRAPTRLQGCCRATILCSVQTRLRHGSYSGPTVPLPGPHRAPTELPRATGFLRAPAERPQVSYRAPAVSLQRSHRLRRPNRSTIRLVQGSDRAPSGLLQGSCRDPVCDRCLRLLSATAVCDCCV